MLQHGLLRPSFVPPRPQRQLRELTRYRTTLLAERARVVNRVQRVLEDTNLKLSGVATNIMGLSARAMLTALLEGATDPQALARLARGKLRSKQAQLEAALVGQIQEQHRLVLTSQLAHIAFLEEQIAQCDATIEQFIASRVGAAPPASEDACPLPAVPAPAPPGGEQVPAQAPLRSSAVPALDPVPPTPPSPLTYQQAVQLLDTLPGVNQRIAQIILAEVGVEMDHFPTAAHLASWVGLCPGNHQSAGKQLRGTTRKGDRWLRQAFIEAAQGAMRTKATYLRAQGERLTRRRGEKRAVVAIAHSILIMAYHMLLRHQPYQDLGSNSFDAQERAAIARQSVRRLEHLGFQVTLHTAGEVA